MNPKLRLVLTITIGFLSFYSSAQSGYWKNEGFTTSSASPALQQLNIRQASTYTLETGLIREELSKISQQQGRQKIIYFPNENGQQVAYVVREKSVLSPALEAKYPGIKSYRGYAQNNKQDKIYFSLSHNGIEAMMVNADEENSFLQKTTREGKTYVLYNREDEISTDKNFICSTKANIGKSANLSTAKLADDQLLRKYRIAVSATGEYTQFHGGTVADALGAINATLTRVNVVFEADLAVTLELVANTDAVIFTDGTTDPYNGNLNTQVQNTLTANIGATNYDVGHLFHRAPDNGNSGFIGSVCVDNQKGSAFASALIPQGDRFDLDYVAHELGHQFGANHTWSFDDEGTSVQAEPGSGTTIMGYAGIAGEDNVALNGDDYFHYFSILQIAQYLETTSCAVTTALSNTPPVISPTGDFIIPRSTAFVLSGSATDVDTGDVLTYAWEQIDNGVVTSSNFGPNRPNGANFRSQQPSTSPNRYFPKLTEVAQGNLTQSNPSLNSAWETVSDVSREFNFALTVRDNAAGGGQVVSDLVKVDVINSSGPFAVTSQVATETYVAGTVQTVSWDIANTNKSPINAQFVDIFLSTDGGITFPLTLDEDVINDGEHEIIIPGTATVAGRIMVKARNNIFFAVNAANFTIDTAEVVLSFEGLEHEVCQPDDLAIPFNYETYLGFNEAVTFDVLGAPSGLGITFTPVTATDNDTDVVLDISNTAAVAVGSYPITVRAVSASITKQVILTLNILDAVFTDVVLTTPVNNATEVSRFAELEWEQQEGVTTYELEIATDPGFTNTIEVVEVNTNSYLPENTNSASTYYWRVKPKNSCGEGSFGAAFSFTTIEVNCKTLSAAGLPITISSTGTPTVTRGITFLNDLPVTDVNVLLDIEHSFLGDLVISLTSPSGTTIQLTSNSCDDFTDIDAVFDDEGSNFSCGGPSGISGIIQPLGALSSFNGESLLGQWVLEIRDTAPSDGGQLVGFSLEICGEGVFRPDDDGDGVFDDGDDLCLGTPPGTEVDTDGCPVYRFPTDNFNIAIQSISCIGSNDGNITITAAQTMDYTLSVSGNGLAINDSFADNYDIQNLMAGTYSICITGNDGTNDFEPFCFDTVVSEPEPLMVTSVLDQSSLQATLNLSGASSYTVELNGIVVQVAQSQIVLDLKSGVNTLKVSTDLPCQGTYDEQIFISEDPIVYPNPFNEGPTVFLGRNVGTAVVTVHAMNGRLVKRVQHNVNGAEILLDLNELPSGIYLLGISAEGIRSSHKVIRR
ncbi:reprolysin-like metallopeptidase [Muriicola sp. Z0-33]|uniref:zinc-dependent metalloprotease n=1 Tax=Muriicola sp. Z0-33 TaxID=2816957 RepID=UPI002238E297|nr:zinc-dependent metalloprotease family protein [Muriicola sp. Z0-33]MCW5517826.1 proprotein convertase P-domain-containing protein [Muriicola sp. Z0-33]